MKKILCLTLAAVLLLGLFGCSATAPLPDTRPSETESAGLVETTSPPETTGWTEGTQPPATTVPDQTQATDPPKTTEGTEPAQQQKPKDNTGKQEDETKPTDPPETQPTQPVTKPTDPPPTQPPETQPPETQPPETQPPTTEPPETTPPRTEPPETEPPTETTEPPTEATDPPTEPAGCQHDWMCVHHAEEGHWRAGIMCDCGWVAYGNPDELVALWNAHSASFPAAESLFNHGGFGCIDEWIVDTPAYDEWVCRHCGEPKP